MAQKTTAEPKSLARPESSLRLDADTIDDRFNGGVDQPDTDDEYPAADEQRALGAAFSQ